MNVKKIIKYFIPTPVLKSARNVVRRVYMITHGLEKVNTHNKLTCIGERHVHTFFGYYDVSPFNRNNEIVYLEATSKGKPAKIILNTLEGDSPKMIAETNAWNTQQGARLRWYPGSDSVISFNDYRNDVYFNRLLNVETKEEKEFPYPLYDISRDGSLGLSINFERLGVLRPGYGYTNRPYNPSLDLSAEDIKLVDMNTGNVLTSITYQDISNAMGQGADDYSGNYLNHLSFSPEGDKFLFFWLKDVPSWIEASLLVFDIKSGCLHVLERDYRVSHYTWLDNDTILCTGLKRSNDGKLECGYFKYQLGKERQHVGADLLNVDGHPTGYKDNVILSDTYPDRFSFQELFLYDSIQGKKKRLVYSYSKPVKNEEYRTDLHPRFNADKTIICYDANVDGFRHLYLIKDWNK